MNKKITLEQLQAVILDNPGINISKIASMLWVSTRTAIRGTSTLISQWLIEKKWNVPQVQYYPIDTSVIKKKQVHFDKDIVRLLEQERYQISRKWVELVWVDGFIQWCEDRKLDPIPAVDRWIWHIRYMDSITSIYGIDATHKLIDYPDSHLTKLLYGSIYALPEFGKTKYGTWMELAKTYPSIKIFDKIFSYVNPIINQIILKYNIQALCFVQPTAQRKMQIMHYAEKVIFKDTPRISIQKTPWYFPAQKTLSKREDRIANAKASFEIIDQQIDTYENILIIDDAVWSGATLVEIANKLLKIWNIKNIIWFSMVGTANGIFDQMPKYEVIAAV